MTPPTPASPMRRPALHLLSVGLVVVAGGCRPEPHVLQADRSRSYAAELPTETRLELQRRFHQGLELTRAGQYDRALAEFDRCAALHRRHPDVMFQRARLLWHAGNQGAALEALHQALHIDPHHEPAHAFLAEVMETDGDRGNANRARAHWRALARPYGDLLEFNRRLEQELVRGQSHQAYPAIAHLFEGDDDYETDRPLIRLAKAWYYRGIDRDHHRPLKADQIYRGLFVEFPAAPAVSVEYAEWLSHGAIRFPLEGHAGEPPMNSGLTLDLAQQYLEGALDVCRLDSALAHRVRLDLALVALLMGDWDEAIRGYKTVLEDRTAPDAHRRTAEFYTGVAYFRSGQARRAVESLTACRRQRPDLITGWLLGLLGAVKVPLRPEPDVGELKRSLAFTDIAPAVGVDKVDGAGPSAWSDFDRDGDLDLFACGCDTFCALYRNDGRRFVDASRQAGLLDVASGFGATFADYDNDGYADLYISRNGWSGAAVNSLYHNEGDGTFREVTATAGVGDPGSSFVHAWADFDRDGWLDLIIANGIVGDGSTNMLYHNNRDGTFTDVTAQSGLKETPGTRTIGLAVGDYDRDGWPDIFFSSWGTHHRLYHNRGDGTFEEVAARAGVTGPARQFSGYVAFFCDYDNDTWPDILSTKLCPFAMFIKGQLTSYEPTPQSLAYVPSLYHNRGDGTFRDVSTEAGLLYPHGIMGANVADVNNDGYVDLYFGTGDPQIERLEPNAFYANTGRGSFVDLTRWTKLGHVGKGHGITFADFDFDGDLDIYAPQGGFVHGDLWPNAFYRNERGNRHNWVQLLLVGTKSNRMGVGAQVTIRSGDLTLYRECQAGGAFGSSSTPFVHFGLGTRMDLDTLEVIWPSGLRTVIRDPPVNRFLRLREGAETVEVITPPQASIPSHGP